MESENKIPLQIKAKRDGFILLPDPLASFEAVMAYVERRLAESHDFFQRSEMVLDLRSKPLMTDEVATLYSLLVERARVKMVEVRLADDLSFVLDQPRPQPVAARKPAAVPTEYAQQEEDAPLIIRSTCRSGTRIESSSDCVVLGDVNPGAEIIAIGDIIVYGNLRGIAHAGASGDRSARIWALSIEPSQIRIADLVALSARSEKAVHKRYEIALVQGDLIQVATM